MGLFNSFFSANKKINYKFSEEPQISFGRYTDRNKSKLQYEYLEKSLHFFSAKNYLKSYEYFFYYLKDTEKENVLFNKENNRIKFEFIQGSKIVKGYVNSQEIFAEAEVVSFSELKVSVMELLLAENSKLLYSKFAIQNDIFSIKYFSPVENASPKSLYSALKELAIVADFYDDVLIEKFDFLHPINVGHIVEIPIEEKKVKLNYFRKWIKETLQKINKIDNTEEVLFYLKVLLLKIDYLIAPEGVLLGDISSLEDMIFNNNLQNSKELNLSVIESLKVILIKPDKELMKYLYKVDATFAINKPTEFKYVKKFIINNIQKTAKLSDENNKEEIIVNFEYILSYSLFKFGMPAIANDLLQIVWRVLYSDYFKDLGFIDELYSEKSKTFNTEYIIAKVKLLIIDAKIQHSKIKFNSANINFENKLKFVSSFFNEFINLNYD